jgi:hypothetical protein
LNFTITTQLPSLTYWKASLQPYIVQSLYETHITSRFTSVQFTAEMEQIFVLRIRKGE